MSVTTLSPEARNLLREARDWLVGKNPHWVRGTFGHIVGDNGAEIDLEDVEAVNPDYWQNYEYERETYDEKTGEYNFITDLPFSSVIQPKDGCLLTGLLVANNYEQNAAYYEARDFLSELVAKSDPNVVQHWDDDKEHAIISWNDNASRTIDDVRNLFRRAFNRLGGK